MNIHHDTTAGKMHSSATTANSSSHVHQPSVAQRAPSAGSLRPRGNSKRNQKGKKGPQDGHDPFKVEKAANGSAFEHRLAVSIKTKRLDLSLSRQAQTPPDSSARSKALNVQPFQLFPSMVIEHVNHGHQITELWLTNHHVNSLPAEIAVLTNLRVLGLAGNALTTLPVEISRLTILEALYLEKNRLQTLPANVAFPPLLRELRLDNNQLSVFPAQIIKLRLLNRLGLSYNRLKVIPEQIQRLRNLVEFDLDYNRLDGELPDGFAALQRLERLGLEGNLLEQKPVVLDRLPALSSIRLSGNRAKQYLSASDDPAGSTRQLLAVPKRHDGYFRCVESKRESQGEKKEDADVEVRTKHQLLQGIVPCHGQNVLNAMAYESVAFRPR